MRRERLKLLVRGNSRTLRFRLRTARTGPLASADVPTPPLDLTGCVCRLTMRYASEDGKDEDLQPLVLQKTTDNLNEGQIPNQLIEDNLGWVSFYIKPEDTRYIRPGLLNYDVELETALHEVYTVVRGQQYIEADITTGP